MSDSSVTDFNTNTNATGTGTGTGTGTRIHIDDGDDDIEIQSNPSINNINNTPTLTTIPAATTTNMTNNTPLPSSPVAELHLPLQPPPQLEHCRDDGANDTEFDSMVRRGTSIPAYNDSDGGEGKNCVLHNQNSKNYLKKKTARNSSRNVTLPDGRMMDCKNTLHSFDDVYDYDNMEPFYENITSSPKSSALLLPNHHRRNTSQPLEEGDGLLCLTMEEISVMTDPLLFYYDEYEDGIDASNTVVAMVVDVNESHRINHLDGTLVHAEAVAVVDAEIATESRSEVPAVLPFMPSIPRNPNRLWRWRTTVPLTVVAIIVVVSLVSGISGYCGAGYCRSGSTMHTTIASTPSNIDNDQLTVVCQFLNTPNISECQRMTSFEGKALGIVISTEIGLLTQLTALSLNDNRLMGPIPSSLGQLTQLKWLDLSINQLTGVIPSSLGNLTQLVTLDLSDNQLTGSISTTLGNLTQLFSLSCYKNSLYGTIPSSIFHNMKQLTAFLVDYNQLSGTIPSSIGNLAQLTFLSLSDNYLTGRIPTTMGNLKQLVDLDLSMNRLTSTIPLTLGKLIKLFSLGLSTNQLTGTIPSTLGDLYKLTDLNLYENPKLSGTVPSSLCSISKDTMTIRIDCSNLNIVCSCCRDAWVGPLCA